MVVQDYDAISVEDLRGIGSNKWEMFPDSIGAWVAEMDYGTAPAVTAALRAAVDDARFGYLPASWGRAMSEACARWYASACGWEVPAEHIHPVPDVIKVLEIAIAHYSPAGSKVIVLTPAYMPFLTVPRSMGREVIEVPMLQRDGRWRLDEAGIDRAFAAGGGLLLLSNPVNPLGRVLTRDELTSISQIVERHQGRVFADEIHAPITYAGHSHVPYAAISDVTAGHSITAISASKAWNVPGLKCAQLVLSNDADRLVWDRIGLFAGRGASILGVIAHTAAYTDGGPWLREVLGYLDGNRALLGEMLDRLLPEAGYAPPEGTYLAWLDLRRTGLDGDLAEFFRERARVAVINGGACGAAGQGFVRLNFALPRPVLQEAVERMAAAVRSVS